MSPGKKGLEERSSSGCLISRPLEEWRGLRPTVLLEMLLGRGNELDGNKLVSTLCQ
jgi:hypothetical protein